MIPIGRNYQPWKSLSQSTKPEADCTIDDSYQLLLPAIITARIPITGSLKLDPIRPDVF